MTEDDAARLIRDAIPEVSGAWADLGAGTGTFSRALAERLGAAGSVLAIERDPSAVAALQESVPGRGAKISVRNADFTQPLGLAELDGILMANSLHYVPYPEQPLLLQRLVKHLKATGRIVVVEYDRDRGNEWVPYPVSSKAFVALAEAAGLSPPIVAGRMRSTFGGELYCTWVTLSAAPNTPSSHQP